MVYVILYHRAFSMPSKWW